MGRSIISFPRLLPPFVQMEERYATIPADQTLSVQNRAFKIIYFLGKGVELLLPDGNCLQLQEGDALSISQRWTLRYRSSSPGREACNHALILVLSPALLDESRVSKTDEDSPRKLNELIAQNLGGFHFFRGALGKAEGREILQLIHKEADRRKAASGWKISGLCIALVSELLSATDASVSSGPREVERGSAAVEHARHFMLENCKKNLTLTEIAWQVRLSGEHLERLFRKHAGTTVFEFLDEVRIYKAKQLLLTTDLPVVRIAPMCGYSTSSLLGRHFKSKIGSTPLAYRLTARSEERFSPSQLSV